MRPLTSKKVPAIAKPAKPQTKLVVAKPPVRAEAQCCAKTSRTAAGCHD